MDYGITSKPDQFRGGSNVEVTVRLTPEDLRICTQNNMGDVLIAARPSSIEEYEEREELPSKLVKDADGNVHEEERFKIHQRRRTVDNNLYFSHFFRPVFLDIYFGKTSWHADSNDEAKRFMLELRQGFTSFKALLESNGIPAEDVYENFEPVDFDISIVPPRLWFEHTYILGETGGGKTQLLQSLFLQHRQSENPPGFVIIDSQNKMLPLIKQKFPDAIHIDPQNDPPSLNLFDVKVSRSDMSGFHELLDTFRYLFDAGGQPITERQRTPFSKGVALMLLGYPAIGITPTIEHFEDFFYGVRAKGGRSLSPMALGAVNALPEHERRWYENEYRNFDQSCSEIMQRLSNICGQYSPLRPLLAKGRTVDFRHAINNGGVVLINTNANYLKGASSAFFGRFFIKLLEQQMHGRTENSRPLFFMVDEVQEYFDDTIVKFYDQARKRNIAVVVAHQRLAQVNKMPDLRSAITGVAVRFATNVNDHDVIEAAKIWKATPDFIQSQHRQPDTEKPMWAEYALHLRSWKQAKGIHLDFYALENLPVEEPPEPPPPPPNPDEGKREETITISPKVARDGGFVKFSQGNLRIFSGTEHGQVYRVRGRGYPRKDGTRGDLYVTVLVAKVETHPNAKRSGNDTPPPKDDDPTKPADY